MSFFGAVFGALTMYWQWHISGFELAIPFIAFAMIGRGAVYVIRLPGKGFTPSEKAERAIMWSSIAEGIGLFLAATIVTNLHRPDWLLPAMALIVGLHFLPIAFAASFHPFYLLGAALVAAAIIGFTLPAPIGGEVSGLGAAAGLWIAATLAARRAWQAKRDSARSI